jgi:hypothetical protein
MTAFRLGAGAARRLQRDATPTVGAGVDRGEDLRGACDHRDLPAHGALQPQASVTELRRAAQQLRRVVHEYQNCLRTTAARAPAADRSADFQAAAATSSACISFTRRVIMMGIEWLKPGIFFGSILLRHDRRVRVLAVLPHRRQDHAL